MKVHSWLGPHMPSKLPNSTRLLLLPRKHYHFSYEATTTAATMLCHSITLATAKFKVGGSGTACLSSLDVLKSRRHSYLYHFAERAACPNL